jgi:predicted Holliday junction resolvase-like endonuclease
MNPDHQVWLLILSGLAILFLVFKNKDLGSKAQELLRKDEDLRDKLKQEYQKFDTVTADLKDQIKFKNERLEDWSKSEHLRIKELAQDKLNLRERVEEKDKKITETQKELIEEREARKKVLSQKKSGEVRLGHIAEKLAPFLEGFTYDPANASFLGQPIDYVVFEDEEVVFVEIKSGNAKLSPKQKHIKELIENKCVSWKEIRID